VRTVGEGAQRDTLLADLYETVLQPQIIPDVLRRLNEAVDSDGLHLIGMNEARGELLISLITNPIMGAAEGEYLAHYAKIDPRRKLASTKPTGACYACHEFFTDRFVGDNEFYQDFLIPHGARYIIGGNIFREGDRNVYIACNHFIGRPRFSQAKHDLIAGYMFHLSRWMKQVVMADGLRLALSAGHASLQALDEGFMVLDPRRKIVFANAQAKVFLGRQLRRDSYGLAGYDVGMDVVTVLKRVQRTRLIEHVAIKRAGDMGATELQLTFLPVSRERHEGHGAPEGMKRFITSLPTHQPNVSGTDEYEHPDVIVFIKKMAATDGHAAQLRALFGLTPAEARLADSIGNGVTLMAYAEQRSIKITTVRSQVRALLEKTQETNLRTLTALLARLGLAGLSTLRDCDISRL
jgi:DNA-binding CsgD family transcriptional regulator